MTKKPRTKTATDSFEKMFTEFGKTVDKILNDKTLQKNAAILSDHLDKTMKSFNNSLKDERVKRQFVKAKQEARVFAAKMKKNSDTFAKKMKKIGKDIKKSHRNKK